MSWISETEAVSEYADMALPITGQIIPTDGIERIRFISKQILILARHNYNYIIVR